MELHQLRYVLAVSEFGSFSKAADKLFVVQSNVSAQVRKLERELGVELFERRPHEVVLTAFGRAFLPRVRECLGALEDARTSLDALRGLTAGCASLGVIATVVNWLMPTLTHRFLSSYPGVELWLTEEPSAVLCNMVLARNIPQAVITQPPSRHTLLEYEPLFTEELVALLPAGHALCGTRTAPLDAFRDEDVLLPEAGNQLRDMIQDACTRVGFEPKGRIEVGKKQLAHELAIAGIGVAFMPALAAVHDVADAADRVVRIDRPRIVRSVGMARHQRSGLSPADVALAELVRDVVREQITNSDHEAWTREPSMVELATTVGG